MKKLKNRLGESIAETLVAVLIMALAFLMMAGAVLASARVNSRVKNVGEDAESVTPTTAETASVSVTIQMDGTLSKTQNPKIYTINGNYYYG